VVAAVINNPSQTSMIKGCPMRQLFFMLKIISLQACIDLFENHS
jgi:hypothetical protein